jgi:uncharacterized protein
MATELPDEVDCRQLADEAGTISGSIAATRLTRIGGEFRLAGNARARLDFRRDEDRQVAVAGEIEAPIEARCQRCLEWMPLELCIDVRALAMPSGEEDFAFEQNVVAARGGQLKLTELVEDEILLACPMIPAHDERACSAPAGSAPAASDERRNPFAGLADLIKKQG